MSNTQRQPARPSVRLEVDGKLYGGWKDIEINRSLEQCAGTFKLSVTDRWPQQSQSRQVPAGASCRVLVNGASVITGYVDDVEVSYDPNGHTYSVTGRDKTADLVDCCPPSTQLKGGGLVDLARRWAALTKANVGKAIAIVLDDAVYSAPRVNGEIDGGRSSISGNFTIEDAYNRWPGPSGHHQGGHYQGSRGPQAGRQP